MYGTYLRLNVHVRGNWRSVVRAAAGRLKKSALRDSLLRDLRKGFYREMLDYHAEARRLFDDLRL